jgi:hypothetical protein
VKTVPFDELAPYPVRSFTYRNEQVRADEVQRAIVYNWRGGACSVHGRHVKHTQNFNTETRRQIHSGITKWIGWTN